VRGAGSAQPGTAPSVRSRPCTRLEPDHTSALSALARRDTVGIPIRPQERSLRHRGRHMDSLAAWLGGLGLERYAPVFADHDVDLDALRRSPSRPEKLVSLDTQKLESSPSTGGAPFSISCSGSRGACDARPFRAPGQRRQLTVLFWISSVPRAGGRLDPEPRRLMQAYQRACREVTERYDGHGAVLGGGLMVISAGLRRWTTPSAPSAQPGARRPFRDCRVHPGSARGCIPMVVIGETGRRCASEPLGRNATSRLGAGLAEPGCVVVGAQRALARGHRVRRPGCAPSEEADRTGAADA
jgi:hypothetical protein